MLALLLLSTLACAVASGSPQSIFFVNNSINEPGFDSFIQFDAFTTSPPKVLVSNVSSAIDYVSGGVFCDGWYFAIGTNFAKQQAVVTYIDTSGVSAAVTVITPNLFHALACAPGNHAAESPPHIIAIASEYGPKFFAALFDVVSSVLTPLARFPSTSEILESDAQFIFTQNPLVAHAVFSKTDAFKHTPVYSTIDINSLNVSVFAFPLFEVAKPVFALPSQDGVVGLLQLGAYPNISFEWFTGSASHGKLDIKSRVKTPLADFGGLSQGMVQCVPGGSLFASLASGTTNYDNVIVELDIKTGYVLQSMNTSTADNPGLTAQAIACG